MTIRSVLGIAAAVALLGLPELARGQTIGACGDPSGCAQVTIGDGGMVSAGDTFVVGLTFKQGPDNRQAGGIDEIAAFALTLNLASSTGGTPLGLADCTLNGDGLPAAVVPDPAIISNLKVVVENASCTPSRQHCLCPDPGSGIAPDNFVNLVVYGPNPLPTPGPNPIDIPILPTGPQQLLTISLKANANASGTIPLHVYNQAQESSHPPFTAFLSAGDRLAVDQTCLPLAVPGTAPCSVSGTSRLAITDGTVTVKAACAGDCNLSGDVTVDELLTMVDIALGNADISTCLAGDATPDMQITVDEILTAVNNALNGCH